MNKSAFYFSMVIIFGFTLFSCNSTKLIESYKADDISKTYNKVYVVGLTGEQKTENVIAGRVVRRFEERGVKAHSTRFDINYSIAGDETLMKSKMDSLQDAGYDAILTLSLVGVTKEKDFITTASYDTPSGPIDYPYFNDYYSYYGFRAPLIYSKGYYESNTVFNMEATLFDTSDGDLVWIGQTKTVEPFSLEEFAEGYAQTVVDRLIYENVVGRQE